MFKHYALFLHIIHWNDTLNNLFSTIAFTYEQNESDSKSIELLEAKYIFFQCSSTNACKINPK